MKVFLVGEGRHDIGDLAVEPSYRRDRPGFLQPIIEKILQSEVSFDGRKVSLLPKRRLTNLRQALARKASVAALLAWDAEADLLVFVVDLDRGTGARRSRARSDLARQRETIRSGCEVGIAEGLVCVPAVPCRTIEAWALGDRGAVGALNGSSVPVDLPGGKDAEDLWGQSRDPNSNHPKSVLARLLGREATQEDLSWIAEHANISTLRTACPFSFEPFAAELEATS